jgi:hypothetical protein
VDFALTKNTRISERVNFQLRAELYNAFNLHMFVNDGNFNQSGNFAFNNDTAQFITFPDSVKAPSFGLWNGNVSAPRRLQIGARIEF